MFDGGLNFGVGRQSTVQPLVRECHAMGVGSGFTFYSPIGKPFCFTSADVTVHQTGRLRRRRRYEWSPCWSEAIGKIECLQTLHDVHVATAPVSVGRFGVDCPAICHDILHFSVRVLGTPGPRRPWPRGPRGLRGGWWVRRQWLDCWRNLHRAAARFACHKSLCWY